VSSTVYAAPFHNLLRVAWQFWLLVYPTPGPLSLPFSEGLHSVMYLAHPRKC